MYLYHINANHQTITINIHNIILISSNYNASSDGKENDSNIVIVLNTIHEN